MTAESAYLEYYEHLLRLDRRGAEEVATRFLAERDDVVALFVDVLMPAMHHVGSEWERGRITVAQEHFVSAATTDLVRKFGPRLHAGEPRDASVAVAACVPGERHSIGLAMISDVLRAVGIHVHELRETTQAKAIRDFVLRSRADLLCLTCTIDVHLPAAVDLIALVRQARPGIAVVVGGGAIRGRDERILRSLDADYVAADAREVLRLIPSWSGPRGSLVKA